jgi:hypothetical protein
MDCIDFKIIAVHESSHAVLAKLFQHELSLEFMTIAPEKWEKANSEGEILGVTKVKHKDEIGASDSVVLLAGMVGDTILEESPANVQANKSGYLADLGKLNYHLGGADFKIYTNHSLSFYHDYAPTHEEFEQLCLNFLINYLCTEQVWSVVQCLATEVMKKDNLTLDKTELEHIFQTTGYNTFLENNKSLLETFTKKNINPIEASAIRDLNYDGPDMFSAPNDPIPSQ